MINDISNLLIKNVLRAWERNAGSSRVVIVIAMLGTIIGIAFAAFVDAQHLSKELGYLALFVFGVSFLTIVVIAAQEQIIAGERVEQEIRQVEEKARANPEKPEYAWDLARTKLERYLDRNLYEVRAIFFLTTVVMLGGFALVVFGLLKAFADPASLPVSIVSAASGVVLSFIGGSFLLIYRSVLAQSASYVAILERINAVGMAVQIASKVPETDSKLRAETTAALAKTLLTMYSNEKSRSPRTKAS
ncbi:MAG: hypothetical protein WC736_13860 [Gallionella sp.]|jgi:hypothetical protein